MNPMPSDIDQPPPMFPPGQIIDADFELSIHEVIKLFESISASRSKRGLASLLGYASLSDSEKAEDSVYCDCLKRIHYYFNPMHVSIVKPNPVPQPESVGYHGKV